MATILDFSYVKYRFCPKKLSYSGGGANLKLMIFVFVMLVKLLMDLGNCKNRLGGSKADKLRRAYWETTFGIVQNCQEFDKYLL